MDQIRSMAKTENYTDSQLTRMGIDMDLVEKNKVKIKLVWSYPNDGGKAFVEDNSKMNPSWSQKTRQAQKSIVRGTTIYDKINNFLHK